MCGGVSDGIWGRECELINDVTNDEGGSGAMGLYSGELGGHKSLPGSRLSFHT